MGRGEGGGEEVGQVGGEPGPVVAQGEEEGDRASCEEKDPPGYIHSKALCLLGPVGAYL